MQSTPQRGKTATTGVPAAHVAGDGGIVRTPAPITLHTASDTPLRVVVRNISALGQQVIISYDNTGLQEDQAFPQNAYVLPAGTSDTFVLLPGESLYCITPGAVGGQISYIVNVAFPFEIKA